MITSKTAFTASLPFKKDLFFACDIFKAVIIPLPIGFFDLIDNFNSEIKVELQIKSKCGVSPLITHPKTIKPSNRFKFLDITTGISNVPGTLIIAIFYCFTLRLFKAPFIRSCVISL